MNVLFHTTLYRFASACTISLLLLTMLAQARLGQMQGAAASFEQHAICESGADNVTVCRPQAEACPTIVETPPINAALSGIVRPSQSSSSFAASEAAILPPSIDRIPVSHRLPSMDLHPLHFIPSLPFSSVLRL